MAPDIFFLQAQRVMGASMVGQRTGGLDFSALNINGPPMPIPGITSAREAQYARRLKEVEEEMRLLRVENEKNVRCVLIDILKLPTKTLLY